MCPIRKRLPEYHRGISKNEEFISGINPNSKRAKRYMWRVEIYPLEPRTKTFRA